MTDSERSTGALFLALFAVALLGLGLATPWFVYHYSSGRKTAPGGPQDPNDLQVETHYLQQGAFSQSGDATPTHSSTAHILQQAIGWSLLGAAALALLVALGNVPGLSRLLPRTACLALIVLSMMVVIAALVLAWVALPGTMSGYGVQEPFTYRLLENGYIRTNLDLGWIAAALALPMLIGAFAFKYQVGATDPSMVESVARGS